MAGSGSITERGRGVGTRIPSSELRSSTFALGKDLVFREYLSSGVVEVPEMETPAHTLILRTGSPSLFEWRVGARDRWAELPPGSVSLMPEGMREAVRVTRPLPGLASILEIHPSFFFRAVGQIAKGGRIELIRQPKLDDPQIRRLMETLHAEIAAGSPTGTLFGESIAVALSAHVAQQYSTLTTKVEQYRSGLSRLRLNRVMEFISANLSDNLESWRAGGCRRREYVPFWEASVVEVSARTGFVDQSHFSKVFRRIVGIAPSEYRANA